MTGPEHYREAEKLLALAREGGRPEQVMAEAAVAQVHATLAQAAACALPVLDRYYEMSDEAQLWAEATTDAFEPPDDEQPAPAADVSPAGGR
ncbi:hypothetical protein [Prauserella muralis]|uniref:Uncharacterized protein n=1 Tax=Prauserella muralis TaxID=588067 RepID=A0A2V4APU3_9PSEU|nr:hypothetical protein [Prauserella muralis]PXY21146.1 hypothetical protein BAY60_27145 [Prauserella muralis]TWE30234.1 hypothetical protein FHX69_2931 [Prauserella muralis]